MARFSANLGFLWTELPLDSAIRAAANVGFDAVECHWPYEYPPSDILGVINETGLPMMSINTRLGDHGAGDFGLAALSERKSEAKEAIIEAIDYAQSIKAANVHVMAGIASGANAHDTFLDNLKLAADYATEKNITILIEPINPFDAPGYFLNSTGQAIHIINAIGAPNLKLMFDCYHVARSENDVDIRLKECLPWIGHIQFASVPDRGPPDSGELDYTSVFELIGSLGYEDPLGAEYKPHGETDSSLGWLKQFKSWHYNPQD